MSVPHKLFVNVYAPFAGQSGTAYATKELADQMAARGRLACIEINLMSGRAGLISCEPGSLVEIEIAK